MDKYDVAEEYLTRAKNAKQNFITPVLNLAYLYSEKLQNRFNDALQILTDNIQVSKSAMLTELGDLYYYFGEDDNEALRYYTASIEADPHFSARPYCMQSAIISRKLMLHAAMKELGYPEEDDQDANMEGKRTELAELDTIFFAAFANVLDDSEVSNIIESIDDSYKELEDYKITWDKSKFHVYLSYRDCKYGIQVKRNLWQLRQIGTSNANVYEYYVENAVNGLNFATQWMDTCFEYFK